MNSRLKKSFIVTVFNEERTVRKFLNSLFSQTVLPEEIIIVDGGSTDTTVSIISQLQVTCAKNKKLPRIILFIEKGNRSVGRNKAIRHAKGDIILCSDSGVLLDKNWIKNISEPFLDTNVDVVSGFYKPVTKNIFQKCLATYTCVMPDKVDPNNFLPSSRSIAFKKSAWKKVKGYPEELNTCEDLVFAQKMKEKKLKFIFKQDAIVLWPQRNNIVEAAGQFFNYARGDGEAFFIRSQTPWLFLRYILIFYLLSLAFIYKSLLLVFILTIFFLLYIVWAIKKNYNYVRKRKAFFMLPLLQFTADGTVLAGTVIGLGKKITKSIPTLIKQNKIASAVIFLYVITMISLITWGIPNNNHPFLYHMDEWHQSQAVRTVLTQGTPNTVGSANGTMFQFYLTGVYLVPFIALKIINPFAIHTAISAIDVQQKLFIILRLNTLLFGIGSMILVAVMSKRFFNIPSGLSVAIFSLNPIWFSLSNYYKYDIALIFWILLALFFCLSYAKNPEKRNFFFAALFSALACATKISAMPLLLLFVATYVLFTNKLLKNWITLFLGIVIFTFVFIITGIPDTLFGKGSILLYLYENVIISPQVFSTFNFGASLWGYFLGVIYPLLFGPMFLIVGIITSLAIFIKALSTKRIRTFEVFMVLGLLIFEISLIPLKFTAGNRMIVLLPFLSFISAYGLWYIYLRAKKIFVITLVFYLLTQSFITFTLLSPKYYGDIRETSSEWIKNTIPKNSLIGVILPPIYEYSPNIVIKEYYQLLYNPKSKTTYQYIDIFKDTRLHSDFVVISNAEFERNLTKSSPKKIIIEKLEREKYKKIAEFTPKTFPLPFIRNQDYYLTGLTAMPYSLDIYAKK
jgi:glycosyltransferase involved in cell wall biosynthesis